MKSSLIFLPLAHFFCPNLPMLSNYLERSNKIHHKKSLLVGRTDGCKELAKLVSTREGGKVINLLEKRNSNNSNSLLNWYSTTLCVYVYLVRMDGWGLESVSPAVG